MAVVPTGQTRRGPRGGGAARAAAQARRSATATHPRNHPRTTHQPPPTNATPASPDPPSQPGRSTPPPTLLTGACWRRAPSGRGGDAVRKGWGGANAAAARDSGEAGRSRVTLCASACASGRGSLLGHASAKRTRKYASVSEAVLCSIRVVAPTMVRMIRMTKIDDIQRCT